MMKAIYIFLSIILLFLLCSCPNPMDNDDPEPTPSPVPTESPVPEETPEQSPTPGEEQTPEVTPESTPEHTPEGTPESTPEDTPEPTPEETAEPTQEETPDPTPEETAEPTPEQTPEDTPEPTPEDTPEPTPLNTGPVEDLTASLCEYVQEVRISWSGHPQAEYYSVYGYDAIHPGANPVFLGTTDITQYSDTTYAFETGQFYRFYRVAWIAGGTEYGLPGPVSLGVTAPYRDYYEPNNDYTLLYDQPGSSVFSPSQPAVLYSIEDGSGGVYADTDWYKYHGPAQFFSVEVTLHTDTMPNYPGFTDYEVFMVFYYNGVYSPAYPLNPGENVYGFSDFGESSGEADVYFKIYPSVRIPRSVIGTYEVRITEGL